MWENDDHDLGPLPPEERIELAEPLRQADLHRLNSVLGTARDADAELDSAGLLIDAVINRLFPPEFREPQT